MKFKRGPHLTKLLLQRIDELTAVSHILLMNHLNRKQLEMLLHLSENEGMLFYKVVDKLADERELHESTIRWNLNKLRKAGLFTAGNKNNKGIPLELTPSGKMVALQYAKAIKNGENIKNEH